MQRLATRALAHSATRRWPTVVPAHTAAPAYAVAPVSAHRVAFPAASFLRSLTSLSSPAPRRTPTPAALPSHVLSSADESMRERRRVAPAGVAAAAAKAGKSGAPTLAAALDQLNRSEQTFERVMQERREAEAAANAPGVKRNKLKQLWHDYGYVGVGTYLSIYVGTLGTLYVAISSGIVGGADVMGLVDKLGMADHFPSDVSPKSSNFLLAWVATKLTEPARAALTVIVTPKVARMLGRAPPKATEKAVKEIVKAAVNSVKNK